MHPFGCKDTDFFANNQIFRIKSYRKLYFEAKSIENSGYVPSLDGGIRRRDTTRRMGYIRIETSRAGRHLPRPYGEQDIGLRMTRVCQTRG